MTGHNRTKQNRGFALLMALIVVSVVVSIGLTILDLSLKQIKLSTNSRDSEIAFHAANAGIECSRYWRAFRDIEQETGSPFSPTCFEVAIGSQSATDVSPSGPGSAYLYEYEVTWGTPNRCSQMSVLTINSDAGASTTIANISTIIPGYLTSVDKECGPGGRCTIIASRGYSRNCNDINLIGTIEREVLLEL
jgi:Tfp pilus assembly protein PilX